MNKRGLIIAFSLALSACGLGALTPMRQFSTSETIVLNRPALNFVQVTSEVGRSLSYNVNGVDNETQTVTFEDNNTSGVEGVFEGAGIGRMRMANLSATLQPDRRTVRLSISVMANMSQGNQQSVQRRLDRFKAALAARYN